MGTFANNLLVYGPSLDEVKHYYRQVGRPAYVAALDDKTILVAEEPSGKRVSEAEFLSKSLHCVILICDIIDSDMLIVDLWRNGEQVDFYVSDEELAEEMSMGAEFPRSKPMTPAARAGLWCECLERPEQQASVAKILAAPDVEKYVFAEEYQDALWQAMGLPTAGIGVDFHFLEQGIVPDELIGTIVKVSR